MKAVLLQNVKKLGDLGDIVEVASGYFENFLGPQKLAKKATPSTLKWAENILAERVAKKEEIVKKAKEFVDKIENAQLLFSRKTTKDGKKLFGAVAEKDIIEEMVKQLKISLEKKQIKMAHHLKEVGDHQVSIHLADDVYANLQIKIVAGEE